MELQESEVASAHWIDLIKLMPPHATWGDIPVDLGSRLAARNKLLRAVLRLLIGHMHFKCILLPNDPVAASTSAPGSPLTAPSSTGGMADAESDLKLWGITLGMTLSLLAHVAPVGEALTPAAIPTTPAVPSTSAGATPWPSRPASAESDKTATLRLDQRFDTGSSFFSTRMPAAASLRAPSMAAIFPTFHSADINMLLFIFGSRYRRLLRSWEAGKRAADRRVNYEGMVLSSFYAALRSALVVSIALRSLIAAGGIFTVLGWVVRKVKERRGRGGAV